MMKTKFSKTYFFLLILFVSSSAFGMNIPEIEGALNYEKVDVRLFQDIKERTGKTEAQIYEVLGQTYAVESDIQNSARAIKYFKEAVGLDPSLFMSWYKLGILGLTPENCTT